MKDIEILQGAKEFKQLIPIKIKQADEFKYSFTHYIPEIVEVIRDLKSKDIFPYNSTVEEKCKHLNINKDVLDRFVYNSQNYLHKKEDFDALKKFENEYKDWIKPSEELLRKLSKEKKYVTVVSLSKEPFKAKPFFDAEDRLFWMRPRYKIRGFILSNFRIKK